MQSLIYVFAVGNGDRVMFDVLMSSFSFVWFASRTPVAVMAPKAKAKREAAKAQEAKQKGKERARRSNHRQTRRRHAVADLNRLAHEFGLEPVPVKAPCDVVENLVRALDKQDLDHDFALQIREAAELYVSNGGRFGVQLGPIPEPATSGALAQLQRHRVLQSGFTLKSKAFMLTYNNRAFSPGTWTEFLPWVVARANELGALRWAACLEKSEHARAGRDVYHTHAYLWWTDGKDIFRRNTDDFLFQGVRARVDVCNCGAAKARSLPQAATHGLWYVAIKKEGTLFAEANFHMWRDYDPKPEWLRSLWGARKLSHSAYEEHSRRLRVGYADRKRDLTELLADERQDALRDHVSTAMSNLQASGVFRPMRPFPQVESFVESFRSTKNLRRPILAIVGGTNLGKSILVANVLKGVGDLLGVPSFLEVTVEGDSFLDLTDFDVRFHAGVLLDGIGDASVLKANREVLQGRPKLCKAGRSPTMRFSTAYSLHHRAVVATFDLSAANLHLFDSDHWLSNSKNVVCLRLTVPAWTTSSLSPPPSPQPDERQEQMRTWSASGVVSWALAQDLEGPSAVLFASSVNGADLLEMTAEVLVKEVRLAPFAASKVLRARDTFLAGA